MKILASKKRSRCKHFWTSLSPHFFIVKQQICPSQSRFGACCLTILIYTFKLFKGATNPRHTYISGFLNVGLWYERCRFMV